MEHLAIMAKGYIDKILSGEKTIESRFSVHRITPYHKIAEGDRVYMQEAGKEVTAMFEAGEVLFFDELSEAGIDSIRIRYGQEICADDTFWDRKKEARYATLIYIKAPTLVTPFKVDKHDRSAFKTVESVKDELVINRRTIVKHPHDCLKGKHYFVFDGHTKCQFCGHRFSGSGIMRTRPDYRTVKRLMEESMWNDQWFHADLDNVARGKLRAIGRDEIRRTLEKSIGRCRPDDGRQTPYYGNPVYYAQHSLGCCCRKCLEKFYGIPRDAVLTCEDVEYFTSLVSDFLKERLS